MWRDGEILEIVNNMYLDVVIDKDGWEIEKLCNTKKKSEDKINALIRDLSMV